jgi:hypothetical protein
VGTSLVRLCLDIMILNKINYYTPADYVDRGSWSDFRIPHSRSLSYFRFYNFELRIVDIRKLGAIL